MLEGVIAIDLKFDTEKLIQLVSYVLLSILCVGHYGV